MAKYSIEDTTLTNIANAIRNKTGDSATLKPSEMPTAIEGIETGSSGEMNVKILTKMSGNIDGNPKYILQRLITEIPTITVSGTSMQSAFEDCINLTKIPTLNTNTIRNMQNMFRNCAKLTEIPLLNTSNATNFYYMFADCDNLITIPQFDTSNVKDMSYMFYNCYALESIPLLNTSNVTKMDYMFYSCRSLLEIPQFDTSNVTNMSYMLYGCDNLITIPLLNTSKVTAMTYVFYSCDKLKTIPQLDLSSATSINYILTNCPALENFGGFLNLGAAYLTSRAENYTAYKLDLSKSTKLTHDSLMNVINGLYDIATLGCKIQQLTIGATNLAKLTAEEIAIATSKGWSVA
ncbi:MAG: BspA family leucine-rich repeat surface protein [Firmicutes bacterium]|nr:BspA family leucine-rich repeat surface protein [Bacillota bacterium]